MRPISSPVFERTGEW